MSDLIKSLDHPLLRRLRSAGLVVLLLALVGATMRPIEVPAWRVVRAGQPEMNLDEIEGALGQGLVVGVLGGFRTILADFLWIRLNTIWERRDRTTLDPMIRLVTMLDPQSELFWINSARIIAYDVPSWRIREEGGYDAVQETRQRAIDREQAEQAFIILDRAREFLPEDPKLYLETGQIYLNRLKDYANAAEWFLKASELPGAPYYAARMYAELLRRQGKDAEAYDFLKNLYGELPNDPYAQKGIILERVRDLEDTLTVPARLRFQPQSDAATVEPDQSLDQ